VERKNGLSPRPALKPYRMLIEAVTDYAIYMLDPMESLRAGNPGAKRFKGYEEPRSLVRTSQDFYTDEDRRAGLPARGSIASATQVRERRLARPQGRTSSGPMSSSTRSGTVPERSSASPRSHAI